MGEAPGAADRGTFSLSQLLVVACALLVAACSAPSVDAARSGEGGGGSGGTSRGGVGGGFRVEEDLPSSSWAPPEVLARRLARMVWDAEPDASVTGGLVGVLTRDSIDALARRMLTDPRARDGVRAFYRWWLFFETDRTNTLDPSQETRRIEAPALGSYLTLDMNGTFTDLLTVPYTFMNDAVAAAYGIAGISGPELRRIPYPTNEPRIGLLTGAGVLSFYSSLVNPSWPAKRSWMVTDPLLCTPIIRSFLPSFIPDVDRSIRQQMIDATADLGCMACHKILNSPGFAFIGFDSFGRWHPERGAASNETQGWIPAEIMSDAPLFDGPAELARLLASRDETRRCFVRQWLQFAVDRSGQVSGEVVGRDGPSVEVAFGTFSASGFRLRDLIVAVVRTNVFLRP